MSLPEMLGTIGVALILLAFTLNLMGVIHRTSPRYLSMNLVGGVLSCVASMLIGFIPFVILEGTWAAVALGALCHVSWPVESPNRA